MSTQTEILGQIDDHLAQAVILSRELRAALAANVAPPSLPPLAPDLAGSRWTESTARAAVGILVRHARAGTLVTYKELHNEVVSVGGLEDVGALQKYSRPLDKICLAFEQASMSTGIVIPLLTVLVVNARTGLPGGGTNPHLGRWLRASHQDASVISISAAPNEPMPKPLFDIALHAVQTFKGWDAAMAAVGLTGDPAQDMKRA
jgi:hypothetical protein